MVRTGWAALEWGALEPDETVAVFGCGPVGLVVQKLARLRGARQVIAIDVQPYRLEMAEKLAGARAYNARRVDVVNIIRGLTCGRGADLCVDAVGMEPRRNLLEKTNALLHSQRGSAKVLRKAIRAVRRGGRVAIMGVYSTSYSHFPLGQLFDKGVTLVMGQSPVQAYVDKLLTLVQNGQLHAQDIITHVLPLKEAPSAYRLFNKKRDHCIKVVLKP